jgi:hypothetical protein
VQTRSSAAKSDPRLCSPMDQRDIDFTTLRDDWYQSNQLIPRLARKVLEARADLCFVSFPRHWIPVFEHFGLSWRKSSVPSEHVPIFSDMTEMGVAELCARARQEGTSRTLLESVAVLDPIVADFLYIVDNTATHTSLDVARASAVETVRLTNWQSYGRPEIRALMGEIDRVTSTRPTALILPCARKRPYDRSRTHARVMHKLIELGFDVSNSHKVVITSLGVVPEEFWAHPIVVKYDAGVPDVYRTLHLARKFFRRNRYATVVDCLEFPPYSDVLRIILNEGGISRLERVELRRSRQFWLRDK